MLRSHTTYRQAWARKSLLWIQLQVEWTQLVEKNKMCCQFNLKKPIGHVGPCLYTSSLLGTPGLALLYSVKFDIVNRMPVLYGLINFVFKNVKKRYQ